MKNYLTLEMHVEGNKEHLLDLKISNKNIKIIDDLKNYKEFIKALKKTLKQLEKRKRK